jgi:hypothetical protein
VPTLVVERPGGLADTIGMFLRFKTRKNYGKEHRYWSVVENCRVADGRVVQRQVLYLGEVNDTQHAAWRRSIAVFDEGRAAAAQVIALIVTPDGFPLAYEVLPGNTLDKQTLKDFLGLDRDPVRQGRPDLGDGSGHSHRRDPGAHACLSGRRAVELSVMRS